MLQYFRNKIVFYKLNKIGNQIAPILLIDDIYDTGYTMKTVMEFIHKDVHPAIVTMEFPKFINQLCLYGRSNNDDVQFLHPNKGKWVVFPWEE